MTVISLFSFVSFLSYSQNESKLLIDKSMSFESSGNFDSAFFYALKAIELTKMEEYEAILGLELNDSIQINDTGYVFNFLATSYYKKWLVSKSDSDLVKADSFFLRSHKCIPKSKRYIFSLPLARFFIKNNDPGWLCKEWYFWALYDYDKQVNSIFNSMTLFERLTEKQKLLMEFIDEYSLGYGECEDALEFLRDYKTDFNFDFMYPKPDKTLEKLWNELVAKDNYLFYNCPNDYLNKKSEKK